MISYQEVKTWLQQKENKDKIVTGVSFVLVFLVGYGAGGYVKESRPNTVKTQPNYTIKPDKSPLPQAKAKTTAKPAAESASSTVASNCPIKGNISSSGKKIYHIPGGAFYKIVKPEQCFNTEAEALAAGFIKSSR